VSQNQIESQRLIIRPFSLEDLAVIHRILDQTFGDGTRVDDQAALQERQAWLHWSMLNQEWLPKLYQPPLGDRAVVLKTTGQLIGAAGYVPLLCPFEQIPELGGEAAPGGYNTLEIGLFWVIDPAYQKQGYATEAGQALIDYGFRQMRLKRILATTEYSNEASQGVMRKLGMTLARNPFPEPPWLQVVGLLENTG
jgi:RimJ/RimL family protein N-acetyltransferase